MMSRSIILLATFGSCIALVSSGCQNSGSPIKIANHQSDTINPGAITDVTEPISTPVDYDSHFPRVKIATSLGDIVVALNGEQAPDTVLNFVQLVREKFYDGTLFHRVTSDSLVQGGGFLPNLERKISTTPRLRQEPAQSTLPNDEFTIAMIRGMAPKDARDTEIYINFVDNPELGDPKHQGRFLVFGRIVQGYDTLDSIQNTEVDFHPDYAQGRSAVIPTTPIIIRSIRLISPFDAVEIQRLAAAAEDRRINKLSYLVKDFEKRAGRKAVTSDTGLIYIDLRLGDGAQPLPSDSIEFMYHGTLVDGAEFETTRYGQPAIRVLNKLVKGLQEGILPMQEGGLRAMIIPPHLGFPDGIPGRIPPNSTIIFEIELLSVLGDQE